MKDYLTVDDIMIMRPCLRYTRELVKELVGKGGTPLELFDQLRGKLPRQDLVWFGIICLGPRDQRLFACACAERVLPIFEREYPKDLRPREAIKAARLYAMGEISEDKLKTARDAVWDAWDLVDDTFASDAAESALCVSYTDESEPMIVSYFADSTHAASYAAGSNAVARDAETEQQIILLRTFLETAREIPAECECSNGADGPVSPGCPMHTGLHPADRRKCGCLVGRDHYPECFEYEIPF